MPYFCGNKEKISSKTRKMPRPENMTKAQLDNLEKGRFRKGESGNPNGRPKNTVKEMLRKSRMVPVSDLKKIDGLSKDEIDSCERIPLTFSEEGVRAVLEVPGIPLYLASNCKKALEDYTNGDTREASRLRALQYGEPPKNIDVTTAGQPLHRPPSEMTEEEIKAELGRIMKSVDG